MPRKARLNVSGTVAHIMARSLKSEKLFGDDEDRTVFLSLLAGCLGRVEYRCYGWALMKNHYHLIVRSGDQDLWHLMKPLNTGFAHYHKKKYRRDGPLFRDRYKSIITQDQNYIGELVRYVHLNPVRAGVCGNLESLDEYPWCGHSAVMGKVSRQFQDVSTVLRRFGKEITSARHSYRSFLQDGIGRDGEDELVRLVRDSNAGVEAGRRAMCWVIGDPEFVKRAVSREGDARLRISRFEKEGRDLDYIAKKVARALSVGVDSLKRRSRGGAASEARKCFVYIAVHEYRAPSRLVAAYCGTGTAAVSAMARAGREIARKRDVAI